jgi:hypothetical protein
MAAPALFPEAHAVRAPVMAIEGETAKSSHTIMKTRYCTSQHLVFFLPLISTNLAFLQVGFQEPQGLVEFAGEFGHQIRRAHILGFFRRINGCSNRCS